MNTGLARFDEVRAVVVKTLGIGDRAGTLTPETRLLDSVPELDSMAVLEVVLALEEHFGLTIDDEDVTGDLFETMGTLAAFVETKLG